MYTHPAATHSKLRRSSSPSSMSRFASATRPYSDSTAPRREEDFFCCGHKDRQHRVVSRCSTAGHAPLPQRTTSCTWKPPPTCSPCRSTPWQASPVPLLPNRVSTSRNHEAEQRSVHTCGACHLLADHRHTALQPLLRVAEAAKAVQHGALAHVTCTTQHAGVGEHGTRRRATHQGPYIGRS